MPLQDSLARHALEQRELGEVGGGDREARAACGRLARVKEKNGGVAFRFDERPRDESRLDCKD